jgi:aminomethyltransferase
VPEITFSSRIRQSPYFESTLARGAASFTVYNHTLMATGYGDAQGEYERLMTGVSMWDVGCERQVELNGPDAGKLAQAVCARDLSTCRVGQAKYVAICDHRGRLLNDPVLLKLSQTRYWLSIADSDMVHWCSAIGGERGYDVDVFVNEVFPMAVQGPKAEDVVAAAFGEKIRDIRFFAFEQVTAEGIPVLACRSGWSKQGGFELFLQDAARGKDLWHLIERAGQPHAIAPGAPHAWERLESFMLSWGTDTDPDTDPFEAGIGQYVSLGSDIEFIGKAALRARHAAGLKRRLVGMRFAKGDFFATPTQPVPALVDGQAVGQVRVIARSPRLGGNLALALLRIEHCNEGHEITTLIDGVVKKGTVMRPPFLFE